MDYLPDVSDGYLPLFVFVVGITAITNALQCYRSIHYLRRVYNEVLPPTLKSQQTPLSARTFGTWNIAVGIARIYASYNMNQRSWYQMSIWTNLIGLVHFSLEAFVYKTARPAGPWFAPVGTASVGLIWHAMQYEYYVRN